MQRFTKKRTWPALAASVVATGFLGGCATPSQPYQAPRPPQVGPQATVAPAPAPLSVSEATALAQQRLASDEFDGFVAVLAQLSPPEQNQVLRDLLGAVAQKDPWRAGRIALALPAGEWQESAMEVAAPAMVARDGDATIRWVLAATSPEGRAVAGRAVVEQWVKRNPSDAMTRLLAQPESKERNNLLGLLAARWTQQDAAAALAAARAIPTGEARQQALTSVGYQLASTQPARAVEVAALIPDGAERWRLYSAIAQTWVASDAAAAFKWANALPAGNARLAAAGGIETGIGGAAYRPLNSDNGPLILPGPQGGGSAPVVAATPVTRDADGLPIGAGRDEALRERFEEMLRQSPRRAAEWVARLPQYERNDDMVRRLTREWYLTDPQAAKTWVELNVPSVAQQQILLDEARR